MSTHVHLGHIIHIAGRPAVGEAAAALVDIPQGALAYDDETGVIEFCGPRTELPTRLTDPAGHDVHDHGSAYIIPGFVDAHIHFPQTYSLDAYGGGQLLEWLNTCIFPAEARLADVGFAEMAARDFTARRVSTGTTAAMVFGSAFPDAQDALFAESLKAGLRTVSGRGIQTVGPESAAPLLTSEADAIALTRAEIETWHGKGERGKRSALLHTAIVPRFTLSVTTQTLTELGELYGEVAGSGVYVHTHLNENNRPGTGEIDTVKKLFEVDSYLDTYDGNFLPGSATGGKSLLGRRTVLAHAVHCTDAELARMAATGTSIAHCPTSQLFLGSGTMPWLRTVASGVTVAAGTDCGAGDEWLISRVLSDAFKVHISEPGEAGYSMHPAELLFTGTLAGARALDAEDRFGNFDVGKEADFLVIEPDRWPPLAKSLNLGIRSDDAELARDQELFTLLMGLREPAIAEVYVQGRHVDADTSTVVE
ncbi:amidohydrolase family protein [Gordonia sp. NB41Y]|uniref:amidohydrolase family protein n=1 Tax=Gordonia sp. NB41Y TaxID=875808 RepID=UPI0002BE085A|nr:amidohydrolase family protein [Gordonia sp. NB41Y]EMP13846.1 guanine deaminase [Gordonia sp. NB41Y]WLP88990.1 amidohydrolase family protein [Gordonia sp. NB41Y]